LPPMALSQRTYAHLTCRQRCVSGEEKPID
jgi:hypothetical protein